MGSLRTIEHSGGRKVSKRTAPAGRAEQPRRVPKTPPQTVEEIRSQIAFHFAVGAKRVLVYRTRAGRIAMEHDSNTAARTSLEQVLALPAAGGVAGLYTHTPAVDVLREDLGATR